MAASLLSLIVIPWSVPSPAASVSATSGRPDGPLARCAMVVAKRVPGCHRSRMDD